MPKETFFNLPSEKKEMIKQATYDMFINNKYEDIHIRDITKKAGISIGSFYQYFYDKDDLYLYFFTEGELKYLREIKKMNKKLIFGTSTIPFGDICTEEEVAFNRTWYFVPTTVMQKFYFGEYNKQLNSLINDELVEYYDSNKLRDSIDVDLAYYLYTTTMFNIHNYFKEKKIECEEKRMEIKASYFQDIFLNGIMKN